MAHLLATKPLDQVLAEAKEENEHSLKRVLGLHSRRRPTFFTQDHDLYRPTLRHCGYCLVYLEVAPDEAAEYIRRFLRHPSFRTQAQRMGKVVRVRQSGLTYWQVGDENPHLVGW